MMTKQLNGYWMLKVASLVVTTLVATNVLAIPALAKAAQSDFASPLFENVWQRTDLPITTQKTNRSWYWGPKPLGSGGFYEEYNNAPGGKRLVQYFDKSRMELNDPGKATVTNGLLVVEMISGRLQKGDNTYQDVGKAPIPIAGDFNNPWPTYASLDKVFGKPLNLKPGDQATSTWYPAGIGKQDDQYLNQASRIATIQNSFGIPEAFWSFLNRRGLIYKDNQYAEDTISDWLFSTGYPVTEAYWARVKVAGVDKEVLFQAFERRVLTYTPDNDPAYQVEMGNVGLHYIQWLYKGNLPQGGVTVPSPSATSPISSPNPAAQPFLNASAQWYQIDSEVLNVRTAPNTQATVVSATQTQPYIQQVYRGDHVQAIDLVKGEEIEKGNDTWLQIYQKPDLFVYSGYTHKITPGDFPAPSKTFKGIWVAVSLQKQMMAVYEDNKLLYKTLISSGRTSDNPEKDYRTPKGTFSIIGSYRPASQTMEGGNANKATGSDYYKIENIRNVNYFFEDYSIHGTYWHAKFGIQPMSHGCVNASVYDAGLIFNLKAGTTVYIF